MIAMQTQPDLAAVKRRQHATWSSGDYAVIGTTLAITGELLCEAVALRPGQRVLDVAAGNGNATLAAARRWADVTSTDYGPVLRAFAALDGAGQAGLASELTELLQRLNQGGTDTLAVPSEYLEVVATCC